MPAAIKVPSVFTAVDKFSHIISKMGRGVQSFAEKAQAGVSRANRLFGKLIPTLSDTSKQLLKLGRDMVGFAAISAGVMFSYQSLKDYETAVAGFRTIVSDLDDKAFAPYQKQINMVATTTKSSSIDIANSFENIAGLNSKFADTADGLGEVSKASITLSRAARMNLGESAENLVGIMNQFDLSANQANRTINVLAAGQAVGAANISQTAESFKNFGSVAKSSNLTLEQSIGLLQTLASKKIVGGEAGTSARGLILSLQKVGVGYKKTGKFQLVEALETVDKKIKSLKNDVQKDALLDKIFGTTNITAGKIMLDNIDMLKDFTKGVTGTSEAQKAASINANTLTQKIDMLKNSWINYITSNDQANESLNTAKKSIGWITDNMDKLIATSITAIKWFAIFKSIVIGTQIAIFAYNVGVGIAAVRSATLAVSVGGGTVAMNAQKIATYAVIYAQNVWAGVLKVATAAQWLWNAAMTANPIGLIIVGIAALIALIAVIINKWDEWGAALSIFLGPLGFVISLIQSFRRNWDMVVKAFKEGGILGALKAIGAVIFDAILQPVSQLLGLIGKVTGAEWAKDAQASVDKFRAGMGVTLEGNNPPALQTPAQKQEQVNRESGKNTLDVNIRDNGNNVESTKSKGPLMHGVKVNSTQGRRN